jgi:hypothetical protein
MAKDRKEESGLTPQQELAVDLFAVGRTGAQVAEAVGVNPATVSKWLNHNREFREALRERRREQWQQWQSRLLALVPEALDAVATLLRDGATQDRRWAAQYILQAAGLKYEPEAEEDPRDKLPPSLREWPNAIILPGRRRS